MTGTDPARGATGRSGPRIALIVIGIVVLLALAGWAVTAVAGGADDGGTPGLNTSSGPPAHTGATTGVPTQAGNAAIQLTPSLGPDSRRVLVRGSGFGANEQIVISMDGTEAKRLQADASGSFTVTLTVSFSKSSFVVRANGATSNRSASGTVTF